MKLTDMNAALEVLLEAIRTDYFDWTERSAQRRDGELNDINCEMIEEFNENLSVQEGRKYYKIVKGGSVWGFVQKEDDSKFRAGDILKAASWAAPARNAARGNVFNGYRIYWTGAMGL